MTSGYAPDKLNNRHRVLAYLLAVGRKQNEIAAILEYSPNRVSILANAPDMIAEVARLQNELKGSTFAAFLQKVDEERINTLDRLVYLRDNGTKDDNVMLGAAKALLDYDPVLAVELNKAQANERDVIRVSLPRGSMMLMAAAEAELAGKPAPTFDAEYEETPLQLTPPVGGLRAKSPEELEDEYNDNVDND